jgi:hypothetical protein
MRRTCMATAALWAIALSAAVTSAQQSHSVGDASSALPGVKRVPVIGGTAPRVSGAFDAGYGLTESQKSEGAHHRILGTVGLGLVPLRGLELGVLGGIRYDRHPNDGTAIDTGTVGQFSFVTRYSARMGRAFAAGADLGANFPGSEKPIDSLSGPAIDARALFGWVPEDGIRFAGYAGYRFDRTAHLGRDAMYYRAGDRLALGLSDFNAVLVGAGVVVPAGRLEVLGEITGDLLIGTSAPALTQSPLRVDFGVRHPISKHWQAELLSEFALSSRPNITPNSPLIPVEPRFGISIGLRYRIWDSSDRQSAAIESEPRSTASVAPAPTSPPPVAVAPATGRLVVTVVDHEGHPLSDAVVELVSDARTTTLDFQSGSTFAADAVTVGHGHLTVHADLMQDWVQDVEITAAHPLELRVEMVAAEVSGKIRGQIRAFDGKNLPAHVRITPGDQEVQAGSDGTFSVDVPPGKYRVNIRLNGYQPQQRSVEVGKNGIMVLNVDMQKGR